MTRRLDGPTAGLRGTGTALAVVLAALALPGAALAREVPFGVGQTVFAGTPDVQAVAVGDIDGDGLPDLISGSVGGNPVGRLSWYRNNGQDPVAFNRQTISDSRFRIVENVQAIALGDMNGDGTTDVVIAQSSFLSGLALMPNNGTEFNRWANQVFVDGFGTPRTTVAIADMDGDGALDLISCANDAGGAVSWFRNNGASTPAFAEQPIGTVAQCRSVALADVDGNGTTDVVAGGFIEDEVVWFSNDGANPPVFTKQVVTNDADGSGSGAEGLADGVVHVVAVDLDGDGDVDIAAASRNDDQVAWFENDGAVPPSFTARIVFEDPDGGGPQVSPADDPQRLVVFDPDGDGDPDLGLTSREDDQVAWLENDGLTPPSFTVRVLTRDPDGPTVYKAIEIVEPDPVTGQPVVVGYRNLGVIASGGEAGLVSRPIGIASGDLDGDGDVDLVTASVGDDRVAFHENRSCELVFPFQPPIANGSTDGAAAIAAGDIDGDGDVDVVSASTLSGRIALHQSDGGLFPTFVQRNLVNGIGRTQAVDLGDVDGDGDLDILGAAGTGSLFWLENDGATPAEFTRQSISAFVPSPRGVAGGDIDGDGDLDVVVASSGDNAVTLWTNDGGSPPMFTPRLLSSNGLTPWAVRLGDLDGDGDLDVVYAALSNGRVAWLRNGGDGEFEEFEIARGIVDDGTDVTGIARAAIAVDVADLNGDGAEDVISVSAHDDKIAWYRSDGEALPTFTEQVINEDRDGPLRVVVTGTPPAPPQFDPSGTANGLADGASAVVARDLDGDGDIDLAVASSLNNALGWFENTIVGVNNRFQYRGITRAAQGARAISAADLNGDGRPDLVSGAFIGDRVDWYLAADDDACLVFDANGDGEIDASELVLVGRAFGRTQSPQDDDAADAWLREADLNQDGRVDGEDLSALGASGVWGANVFTCSLTCPAASAD